MKRTSRWLRNLKAWLDARRNADEGLWRRQGLTEQQIVSRRIELRQFSPRSGSH